VFVVVVVVVVVVGFIIDPVRKLLDTPSYMKFKQNFHIFFFKIGSTYELSNSAEQSPSWDANSRSASQDIPRLL